MADHFVSLNRGQDGVAYNRFTTGTSSTAGNDVELRVRDGAGLSKLDVIKILEQFENFFENPQLVAPAGFDVSG
jgi:hypothetical protein